MIDAIASRLTNASVEMRRQARFAVMRAMLGLAAALLALAGLGFLLAAAYLALWRIVGAAAAAGILGGSLLVLAGLILLLGPRGPAPQPKPAPLADVPRATPGAEVAPLGQLAAFTAGFVLARRAGKQS